MVGPVFKCPASVPGNSHIYNVFINFLSKTTWCYILHRYVLLSRKYRFLSKLLSLTSWVTFPVAQCVYLSHVIQLCLISKYSELGE